jgi:hypothetical protein
LPVTSGLLKKAPKVLSLLTYWTFFRWHSVRLAVEIIGNFLWGITTFSVRWHLYMYKHQKNGCTANFGSKLAV